MLFPVNMAYGENMCNPIVKLVVAEMTTAEMLAGLAKKYNFSLYIPKGMGQLVHMDESMELNQLIKLLTTGMNTILIHEKIEGCTEPRLTELTVIPAGEESGFVNIEQQADSQFQEYIYIGNMEQYVTEVLMHQRNSKLKKMSPEQQIEFKAVKKRLREDLKDEIKQMRIIR